MGTGSLSWEKSGRGGLDLPVLSSPEVKGKVALYLYSPYGLHFMLPGEHLLVFDPDTPNELRHS